MARTHWHIDVQALETWNESKYKLNNYDREHVQGGPTFTNAQKNNNLSKI